LIIQTINLTKRYGKLIALNNLHLNIEEGECFGYIGPNGAGKTTTIKILSTLLQPTWGEARVCGHVVGYQSRLIRPLIGYVPDFFGAYEDMVVQEYLEFFASAYNIVGKKRAQIVGDVLELTDLSYKCDSLVDSLSRGMKQRLSLARALVHDPEVLILDEPASGLDPRARVELRNLLVELKDMGKTILVSSHILAELEEMCTEIGIMEAGQLLATGPPRTILEQMGGLRTLEVRFADGTREAFEVVDEAAQAALLRRLVVEDQRDILEFVETGGGLEDLFLRITKGQVS
jgi:ABC-2 type transport system ATP-binding protein